MSLEPGEIIEGKYRIVRLIGEGGMGAVYEGENTRINRRVAIKVLHAAFASDGETVKRFEREAQAAGRIGNDHILEVLDLGQLANNDFFMVMEYLDGESLGERIKARGRLTPQELGPLARQALAGLGAAHDAGIIHRDLKPDNIFILKEKAGTKDFVKIIDFGISKFQPLNNEMRMTQTGAVMGTPYYMSPEQAHGSSEVDARSDLYAIGVILYESVTGSVPFDAATFNQLLFKIVLSEPPPARQLVPDLDPGFETLIEKSMARDPGTRFQSAQEFAQAIAAWEQSGTGVAVPVRNSTVSLADITGNVKAVAVTGDSQPNFSQSQPTAGAPIAPGGAQTSGNWASSQAGVPIPKRSNAPLFAALGGVALLVLGGGALAALHFAHHDSPPADSAAAPPASVSAPADTDSAEPAVSSVAEETPPPSASVEPPASASASAEAETPPPSTAHVAARHAPRHWPPPPKKKTKKSGGGVDFGY